MERSGKCAVCGKEMIAPPDGPFVCPRCLLEDVQDVLGDDGLAEAEPESGASGNHALSTVPMELDFPTLSTALQPPSPPVPVRAGPRDTEDLPVSMEYSTVEVLGRYTHKREYARGGMGRILVARDEHLDRDVIIKEMLPRLVDGTEDAELPSPFQPSSPAATRFLREARITGQLQHPSIVPVYELGWREDGTLYYTMKQVQGVTLSAAIAQADGLEDRLELLPHFLDLCQAVSYAHSRGVIHRDIKPGNVMVGEFGETVLLDWGLAKVRGQDDIHQKLFEKSAQTQKPKRPADAVVSAFGQVLGTPAYMAPEQALGETNRVDERTDVYALGAVLYTLLTGKPPFTGERCDAILDKVVNEEPLPVLDLERQVPKELAAICEKAMAKLPGDRYESAKIVAQEIQRFMSGGYVAAYDYTSLERLRHFVRRNQRAVATAAVAVILLVALAVFSYHRILGERDKAVAALAQAETNLRLAETNLGLAENAVDELLSEVGENDLMNQPGMEPVRRKLLESALTYSKQIADQQPEEDEGARRQTAEAQYRLGKIYFILGQFEEALEAYEQARIGFEALVREHPGQSEYDSDLVKALRRLGFTYAVLGRNQEALKALLQARDTCAALVQTHPDMPDYQHELAEVLIHLGIEFGATGKAQDAQATYEQAQQLYIQLVEAFPDDPKYGTGLAHTLSNLGEILGDTGNSKESFAMHRWAWKLYSALVEAHPDVPSHRNGLARALQALGHFEQSREMYAALVDAHPDVPLYRMGLADVFNSLGNAARDTGDTNKAVAHHEQARGIFAELVEVEPNAPDYQYGLAKSLNHLGFARDELGQHEEALAAFQQTQKIWEALVENHPDIPEFRSSLAVAFSNIGVVHERLGQKKHALAQYEQARAVHAKLVEAYPDRPLYRSSLALATRNVGVSLEQAGKHKEALTQYEQARDVYAALVEEYPGVPEYRSELARALTNLGNVLGKTEGPGSAILKYEQARDHYVKLAATHPDVPAYQSELASVLGGIGDRFFDTGNIQQALAACERARKIYAALVEEYPGAPEYQKMLAETCNNVAWRIRETYPEWALEFANQAVALTERKEGNYLDTLAAALFENGQLEEAVSVQNEAISVKGISLDKRQNQLVQRLQQYETKLREYKATLEWEQNADAQWSRLKAQLAASLSGEKIVEGVKGYWSPDGHQLLYVSSNDELRVLDLNTGESTQFADRAVDGGWSPDGRYVAWRTRDREIWIAEPHGNGRRKVGSGLYRGWSQDGKTVYGYFPDEQTIYAFNIDHADGAGTVFCDELPHRASSISPNGNFIVFMNGHEGWIVDRKTRKTIMSATNAGTLDGHSAWSPDGTKLAFIIEGDTPYLSELWILPQFGNGIPVIQAPLETPSWSPDGTKLLITCRGVDPPEIWSIEVKAFLDTPAAR